MVEHGGSSAGSYLADPTSPIPSHCASIVATSTLRVNGKYDLDIHDWDASDEHTFTVLHTPQIGVEPLWKALQNDLQNDSGQQPEG